MKKSLFSRILIISGIIFCIGGVFLYFNESNTAVVDNEDVLLSKDEATSIINQLLEDTIKVYESPSSMFDSEEEVLTIGEEEKTLLRLDNYSNVVISVFSKNGVKQLEGMTFKDEKYITVIDNNVYALVSIPSNSKYINSEMEIKNVVVKKDEITCEVDFSSSSLDEEGIVNYFVISKDIIIVKENDTWLIEHFFYGND